MVKVAFAAQRQHAESPAAVLAGMNETRCGRLAGQYVTAAYLFIDSQSQVIRYGAAGHPPMLRAIRGAGSVDEIAENGLILSFVNGRAYTEVEESLGSGTRFLLYTDGLIEATNVDDDFFGIERLESALVAADGLPASAAADNVLTTIDTWSRRRPSDDLTLVLVDWIS
jgi:sigma-B regulation protein RsbU (phosphoserine phosphatase)